MFMRLGGMVLAALLVCSLTSGVDAAGGSNSGGGSGGGGSVKPLEIRVTGYITAIDYSTGQITVGASYYNTGTAWVTSTTKVSLNNNACDLSLIELGDWAELRYEYSTHIATKLSVTAP